MIETDKGEDNKIYYDDKLGSGDIVRCTYGGFLTVDDKLNDTSKNPVENRVINTAFHDTQNKVDIVRNELKSISDDMFDLRDTIKGSKILWQRNEVNDSNGVVTNEYKLKEKISQQQSGILIIFSRIEKLLLIIRTILIWQRNIHQRIIGLLVNIYQKLLFQLWEKGVAILLIYLEIIDLILQGHR